jgi:hypothetical protein
MPSVISGDANVSATEFGFLDGVTSSLQSQIDSKLNLAGGKILQIVRATDSTQRSTTSTTFVDVTGMSVTITPTKSDSAILLMATFNGEAARASAGDARGIWIITDSSNNSISGAQESRIGDTTGTTITFAPALFAYATPATTSEVTYKLRFRSQAAGTTVYCYNNLQTGQMFAIEVSA